jgi:hypothetical protein
MTVSLKAGPQVLSLSEVEVRCRDSLERTQASKVSVSYSGILPFQRWKLGPPPTTANFANVL